jgi:hypothetical protein
MEPKVSMTAFAAVLAAGLVGACLFGHVVVTVVLAASVLLYGAGMHYFAYARRRRRAPRSHRLADDRRVVRQWLLTGVVGLVAAGVCHFVGTVSWHHTEAGAIAIGLAAGASGVFVSAVFDWYYTHPRLAGLIGPAPCETSGNGRWVGLTNIWYFHRLLATVVVSAALIGVPSTLGSIAKTDVASKIWFFITLSMTAIVFYTNRDYSSVVRFLKNPRLSVGDTLLLNREQWGSEPQRVYVLDVAVEGAKVKLLKGYDPVHVRPTDPLIKNLDDETGRDPGPLGFLQKVDTTMLNDEIARCVHVPKEQAICRDGHCSGVNWYCRANKQSAARAERYPDAPNGPLEVSDG